MQPEERSKYYDKTAAFLLNTEERDEQVRLFVDSLQIYDPIGMAGMNKNFQRRTMEIHKRQEKRMKERLSREASLTAIWESSAAGKVLLSELKKDKHKSVGSTAWLAAKVLAGAYGTEDILNGLNRQIFKRMTETLRKKKKGNQKRLHPMLLPVDWIELKKKHNDGTMNPTDFESFSRNELKILGLYIAADGFLRVHRGRGRVRTKLAQDLHEGTLKYESVNSLRRASSATRHPYYTTVIGSKRRASSLCGEYERNGSWRKRSKPDEGRMDERKVTNEPAGRLGAATKLMLSKAADLLNRARSQIQRPPAEDDGALFVAEDRLQNAESDLAGETGLSDEIDEMLNAPLPGYTRSDEENGFGEEDGVTNKEKDVADEDGLGAKDEPMSEQKYLDLIEMMEDRIEYDAGTLRF